MSLHLHTISPLKRSRRCGLSLLEVTIAMAVLSAILMATASAFSTTMQVTDQARRTTGGAIFLDATLENISALNYNELLVLDGNVVFDAETVAESNYSVSLSIFQSDVNLIQVTAALNDLETGGVIGRLGSLRSGR
ncbi:MAG: prepilin-type N-terminal cleavage/methylation domain-containing protein [Planctomycetota bacterium]|jgi:prepilin-type N-terminal cleavage/methylation domain-containing protein